MKRRLAGSLRVADEKDGVRGRWGTVGLAEHERNLGAVVRAVVHDVTTAVAQGRLEASPRGVGVRHGLIEGISGPLF